MGRVNESYLDELKTHANTQIVDVIGSYIKLSKEGRNHHVAVCSFHDEKTPSFKVNAERGTYKCFGCGAHGGALDFVMEYRNLPLREAVKELAERSGFRPVEYDESEVPRQKQPPKSLARKLLNQASVFFVQQTTQSPDALRYLRQRGVTAGDIERFRIGFAPDEWDALSKSFRQDYSPTILKESGLASYNERRHWDFFRNRIMFPVRDRQGQVAGFGGRTLIQDADEAKRAGKYINTPETDLFKKSRLLYGWYEMLQTRSPEPGTINVVEGYLDVIAAHRHEFTNTVAPMGTSMTEQQLSLVFRQSDHVRLVFDGDNAGRDAAFRAVRLALPQVSGTKRVSVAFTPSGEDPDSLLSAGGPRRFRAILDKAFPASRFVVDYLLKKHGNTSAEDKAAVAAQAKELMDLVQDNSFRDMFELELNQGLGLQDAIRSDQASQTLADQLDAGGRQAVRSARPDVQVLCGLALQEPAWMTLIPAEAFTACPPADAELLEFTRYTIEQGVKRSLPAEQVYSTNMRYLVLYLQSLAPTELTDSIATVKRFQDLELDAGNIKKKSFNHGAVLS